MQISVNLATRPFIELRPLFARLRLAMVALAVLAIALGVVLHLLTGRAQVAQARMDALKSETSSYQHELVANESRMREPRNHAVLERADFLNDLFAKKSFSWTAVMMDLETVLPAGVQVTSIEPQKTKEGDVNIRLRVSGDRDRAVQLVRNLERSKRFLAPHITGEALQTSQGTGPQAAIEGLPGGVEFDILSGYNPLPTPEKSKSEQEAATAASTSTGPRTTKPATEPAAPHPAPARRGGTR